MRFICPSSGDRPISVLARLLFVENWHDSNTNFWTSNNKSFSFHPYDLENFPDCWLAFRRVFSDALVYSSTSRTSPCRTARTGGGASSAAHTATHYRARQA